MKPNARHLAIAVVAALAMAAPVVMFFNHKNKRNTDLSQLEAQLTALGAPTGDIKPLRQQVDSLHRDLEGFRAQTPFQPDISVLLAELATDLPEATSNDREIVMRPSAVGAVLSRNPVLLRMKGPCDSTLGLLRRIEKYRFLTRVGKVVLEKRDPESPHPPQVELEFVLFSQASAEALSCQR